jgi:hypothetical protein
MADDSFFDKYFFNMKLILPYDEFINAFSDGYETAEFRQYEVSMD